jgi:teichuronic acid biosynthesis glycosyltransferase TuaG
MPKVSVNVPCFNSEKYIAETLQSVLDQTFEDFEIIVVNDGSTDRTEEIVKTFSDPRIKYYYQKNMGLSNTRNRQLALSSGEFIAFLDHDDIWMPEKLELQLRTLIKENANFCYTKVRRITYSKEGKEISSRVIGKRIPYSGHRLIMKLCERNPITGSSVMIESKLCKKIGFNPRLKRLEGYDHILRASPDIRSSYVDRELVIYRMYPTNTTTLLSNISSEELKIINESFVKLNLEKVERRKFYNNIIVTEAYEKADKSFNKFLKYILPVLINDIFFAIKIILSWLKEKKIVKRMYTAPLKE